MSDIRPQTCGRPAPIRCPRSGVRRRVPPVWHRRGGSLAVDRDGAPGFQIATLLNYGLKVRNAPGEADVPVRTLHTRYLMGSQPHLSSIGPISPVHAEFRRLRGCGIPVPRALDFKETRLRAGILRSAIWAYPLFNGAPQRRTSFRPEFARGVNSAQTAQHAVQAIRTSKKASEVPCRVLGLPIPKDFRTSSARLNPSA